MVVARGGGRVYHINLGEICQTHLKRLYGHKNLNKNNNNKGKYQFKNLWLDSQTCVDFFGYWFYKMNDWSKYMNNSYCNSLNLMFYKNNFNWYNYKF